MDASSPPSESERELNELRRRVYGPHPDFQADPTALARLEELEAARRAGPPDSARTGIGEPAAAADGAPGPDPARTASREDPPQSLTGRFTARRARRSSFVAGALVVFFALALALAYSMASLVGQPRPDAVLHPVADEDNEVFETMSFPGGRSNTDESTIRGYQPYRGVQPVFHIDRRGYECLMLTHRSHPWAAGDNCVPLGVDLFADTDTGAWPLRGDDLIEGLPDGSIVRFHYRGHSVDVFLYPASRADEGSGP